MPGPARGLAVLAVLSALSGAGSVLFSPGGSAACGPLLVGVLLLALPSAARQENSFRFVCPVIGWIVFVLSVLGTLSGLLVLAVPALALVAAGTLARPEPGLRPLLVGVPAAVAALGWAALCLATLPVRPNG